jgi:DeoR family fructose operon transcriptional repressor
MMEIYYPEERQIEILEIVNRKSKVSVYELSKKFNVSEATIRRDLNFLKTKKMIIKTHGGALKVGDIEFEHPLKERKLLNLDKKETIAKLASTFIVDNDTIFISGGTTTTPILKYFKSYKYIRVLTNSIEVCYELSKFIGIELTVIGGELRKDSLVTAGQSTINYLNDFNVNKLFVSVNGIDIKAGLTTPNPLDAETIKKMIKISKTKILLIDSTKFGKVYFTKISPINAFDIIITDDQIDKTYLESLKKQNINTCIAKI